MAKSRITQARRRHQDWLRRETLKSGRVYESRLVKLRSSEAARVLRLCRDYSPDRWTSVIEDYFSEGYLATWFRGLYLDTGRRAAGIVTKDLTRAKADSPGYEWDRAILEYAEDRAGENVALLEDTARKGLQATVRKTMTASPDLGIEKLAKAIYREWTEDVLLWQARRIAQTETMISLGKAADVAAESLEIGYVKEWCISGLGNTRDSHEAMDGVRCASSEAFTLPDGSRMMYPHDTQYDPPAGEIINCACTCIYDPI